MKQIENGGRGGFDPGLDYGSRVDLTHDGARKCHFAQNHIRHRLAHIPALIEGEPGTVAARLLNARHSEYTLRLMSLLPYKSYAHIAIDHRSRIPATLFSRDHGQRQDR